VKKLITNFLTSDIFRNIKIGLISSGIAAIFFYYSLDTIIYFEDNILINNSGLFLSSVNPLMNGSSLLLFQDPELATLLFSLFIISIFSVILVSLFNYLRFKLYNLKEWGSDSNDYVNKKSWIFQIILLLKKRWILISLSMIIYVIALLSLQSLLVAASGSLMF
jgi:hypothetical protein